MVLDILQSITRSFPEPVERLGKSLIGEVCYDVLVRDLLFLSPPISHTTKSCIAHSISKLIGLGIVTSSAVIKIPQITKLVRARSAEGVSVAGTVLECASYLASFAYAARLSFPFSTYGEQAFLYLQDVVLVVLLLVYSDRALLAAATIPVVGLITFYLLLSTPGPALSTLKLLQTAMIPLAVASKVPQIVTNFRKKSTGQLSAVAVFAYFAGGLARVFTTLQEVDDVVVLAGSLLSAAFNGVLVLQMLAYWRSSAEKRPTNEKLAKE